MKPIRLMTLLAVILFSPTANAQQEQVKNTNYHPQHRSGKEMGKVKANIALALNGKTTIDDKKHNLSGPPKDIQVLDDRIEVKIKDQQTTIYFSDIIDDDIVAQQCHKINPDGLSYRSFTSELQLKNYTFIFKGAYNCNEFADDLFFIQYQLKEKRYNSELVNFEPIAKQFRTLKVKPTVSEEQRKYIVQANHFNQDKLYDKAIGLYINAIEVDQTAYPAAYSNLALLSAQTNQFGAAICYMKKYLMLVPDAEDARSAQDKIYEWEAEIGK